MTEIGTELVIERIFDAPRELVYQALSTKTRLRSGLDRSASKSTEAP
ncbi:hypothetical protein RSal33209_2217 [Renibacterium salmoninarum ATCC 33209]|uniref:Uncharacterized protein n=1 Tax=Renibacterium salmoninarum (strain ATCC 33209 / DSM 20767 / JCM 11484 / NBRC 15589 / NCIMB 2235) TaxID=288705 RepID=A9WT11_RENSM|nr:hypothetical protein [Renibacterium salmoninarum]ABY23949.1 hypothetical protein RSal33209_2217 [Renibacterium salmoninarum ATCC 33209]